MVCHNAVYQGSPLGVTPARGPASEAAAEEAGS
jgi:hypothetical protein